MFLSVPRLANEPQQCDSSVKPYPIDERFLRYYAAGLQVTERLTALRALDGVGGRVFTRRIEHTFEYAMIRMGLKVLL
jgi:hypothetical protein